ncbi:hypothetical protein, partial [Shigella flexneri]
HRALSEHKTLSVSWSHYRLNVLICNGTCQGLKDERKFIQRINFKGFYCLLTKTGIMFGLFLSVKSQKHFLR